MLSERLKEETQDEHITLEKLIIPRVKSLESNHSYSQLLNLFYGYFKPIEEKIEQYIDQRIVIDIQERRKAATLLADIQFIGELKEITLCNNLPLITNTAQALGAMYVVEGSTLGGKFLSKMIAERLGFASEDGLRFFTGYGFLSSAKWNSFKAVLNNFTNNVVIENEVIEAANQTFIKFKNWIELH